MRCPSLIFLALICAGCGSMPGRRITAGEGAGRLKAGMSRDDVRQTLAGFIEYGPAVGANGAPIANGSAEYFNFTESSLIVQYDAQGKAERWFVQKGQQH